MTSHADIRDALLADPDDSGVIAHAATCVACGDLLRRVDAVRRVAPTLAGAPVRAGTFDGIADRVVAQLRGEPRHDMPKRALARAFSGRVAVAAVVLAVLAVAVPIAQRPATSGEPATATAAVLSDALLVSAQRTADTGSARLHLTGSSEVVAGGRTIDVRFGGTGALTEDRLRYRGLTRVGDVMIPCELTVIGPSAWMRKPDGSWLEIDEPVGALAPVVLDAGSILEVLRMPKDDVRLIGEDDASRTVAFEVTGRPGLVYEIVAVVGRADDLLRHVDIAAAAEGWKTQATMTLYGFGEPVTIHPPAAADVIGTWEAPDAPVLPVRALYPVG